MFCLNHPDKLASMKTKIGKIYCFLILGILFSISLCGCVDKDDMIDFPVAMEIEIRELFHQNERQLALLMKTVQEYECANYQIEYDYAHQAEKRIVELKGIILPSMCLTAFGPATAFVNFGTMDQGRHEVHFLIDEDYLFTDFLISEDKINVFEKVDEIGLIGFVDKTVYKLSDDYVWGYVMPKTSGDYFDPKNFLDAIWEAGAKNQELSPGNYGFFRITEEEMIIFDHEISHYASFPIICTYEGQFEALSQIADDFAHEFVIVLYSAQGEYHRNQY